MIIGLHSDKSRAGKDSIAGILVRKYGFQQVALASAIREMMLRIDPLLFPNHDMPVRLSELYKRCDGDWDRIKAESRDSVDFMIGLGQSARDIVGEGVWIQAAFPQGVPEYNVVVSDIRQPNEVTFIQEHGGELWYVERPSLSDSEKRGMDGLLSDVGWDAHIVNDGDLADLEETVDRIMTEALGFQL